MRIGTKKAVDLYLGGLLLAALKPPTVLLGALLRRDHSPRPQGRIGVVKLLGGGSLVLALPALLGIRRRHPDSRLFLVTTKGTRPFAELLGVFDEIVAIDDSSLLRLLVTGLSALWKSQGADSMLDLEVYSRLSTVFCLATRARNRLSFYLETVFWRRRIATHLVFFNRFSPVHVFYGQLAGLLDAAPASIEDCRRHVAARLPQSPGGRRVCVGPGCSSLGLERRLTGEQWAALLLKRLPPEPMLIEILGAADDRELGLQIAKAVNLLGRPWTVHNLCGTIPLAESVARIAGAERYFGIDSGLLHAARLLGVPTTSCWGPTDPATLLFPIPGLEEETLYRKIPCSPCIHVAELPPCGGDNVCIRHLFDPESAPTPAPTWCVSAE